MYREQLTAPAEPGRERRIQAAVCKVCGEEKPASELRRSSRNRTLHFCRSCKGTYRCIHCGRVKPAREFKANSGRRGCTFDDGERIRTSVCYGCDYQLNKERYARYDRRVYSGETLRHLILSNRQRWRDRTRALGQEYDLVDDDLVALWYAQAGRCHYTGEPMGLERGHGRWQSASLDRLDPALGYVRGNVVWTTRQVNTAKSGMSVAAFVAMCRRVAAVTEDQGAGESRSLPAISNNTTP